MLRKVPPIDQQPNAIVLPDDEPVDFAAIFGNDHPVEIEVGTGKGTFLVRRATLCPERNFLGIEWANAYFLYAADRMRRRNLTNVRMLRDDARDCIIRRVPDASVDVLHVYYPDPWPKRKHHKRRFFVPPTVEAIVRILRPGGRLSFATDHAEYFASMSANLNAHTGLRQVDFDDASVGIEAGRVDSNYEHKWLRMRRTIHALAMIKSA